MNSCAGCVFVDTMNLQKIFLPHFATVAEEVHLLQHRNIESLRRWLFLSKDGEPETISTGNSDFVTVG